MLSPYRVLDLSDEDSSEFRGLSPKQIVPRLADEGIYLASESTIYRILREQEQLKDRTPARAPTPTSSMRTTKAESENTS